MDHSSHAKASHIYNVVDDLEQSPTSLSTLKVLHNFPSQNMTLLPTLGVIDPSYSCLMTFDLDQSTPWLPP